ncbi:hypothetical protein [Citrobacter farmeri]|uniref:hypothetical protein n=1 Tax=Citrobacter farmeri TaxID=67824 RepID=UPI00189C6BE6|nr:hypothetical protein [Citrobacter farmeri]MDZ7527297.1 hypothetical protein [Citrobacter farmeri]HED3137394.1 hypothetical protein [Citrobacter farmeri]
MNDQLVNELMVALWEQTAAQKEQTEAINRLAESNVALCDVIIQAMSDEDRVDITTVSDITPQYLSQKARG